MKTCAFAVAAAVVAAAARGVEPAAVWVAGEFGEAASKHGGFALSFTGSEVDGDGNIVIGEDAATGVKIVVGAAAPSCTRASILVKYALPEGGAPAANSVIAGALDGYGAPFGALAAAQGGKALTGYWLQNGSVNASANYAFSPSAPGASAGEGYLFFAYDSTKDSAAYGTSCYTGSSLEGLAGGRAAALAFSNKAISSLSVGGPAGDGAAAWTGMTIKSIALFTGENPSAADLADYVFPAKGGPDTGGGDGVEYPYHQYVTRLDGTAYHGNDANRAIITNWQSQIARPAARPVPSGTADSDFHTIDLVFVYDAPGKEYVEARESPWGGATALEVHSAKAVAKMNQILCSTDLDTNFWFRMVGAYAIDATGGTIREVFGKAESLTGGYEYVDELRDRVGADVVVCPTPNSGGYGGLARVNGYDEIVENRYNRKYCIASVFLPYSQNHAWVHEIGHIMSLNHYAPAGFDPAATWRGLGLQHKISEADGTTFSTVMAEQGYSDNCNAFSSINHIYHGSMLSESNHLDSTGVLLGTAPFVSKWRRTKVPETPKVSCYPQYGAALAGDTEYTLECSDAEATIYYRLWNGTGYTDYTQYTGPFTIPESYGMAYGDFYAEKDGERLAGTEDYIYGTFTSAIDEAVGACALPWSLKGNSVNGGWELEGDALVMKEGVFNSATNTECILSTSLRGPATLSFKHCEKIMANPYDWAPNSSFAVWLDDSPVYVVNTATDTTGGWVDAAVSIPDGLHTVEFVYTRRSAYVSGEAVKVKAFSVDRNLSENPASLSLAGGALPQVEKWTSGSWYDEAGLRYAGAWEGLEIPVSISAATNLSISVDAAISPSSLAVEGTGLVTLRGAEMDFAGPVEVSGRLALDTIHTNAAYTVLSGGTLSGGGKVFGSATIENGGTLSGGIEIGNLAVAPGAVLSGGTAVKSLSGEDEGNVEIAGGVFTVAPGCDTAAFAAASLDIAAGGGGAVALYSSLAAKDILVESPTCARAFIVCTNSVAAASGTINFSTPGGAMIELVDENGAAPLPGRYLVASAADITWTYETIMKLSVADMLNMVSPYGIEWSMDTTGGDKLYATVKCVGTVDAADPVPIVAAGALDGAYVNIEVTGADALAVGDSIDVFEAESMANTAPNVIFTDSRTAKYSTAKNVSATGVSITRTDFNFVSADGAIACTIPLDWVEAFIAAKEGDAMALMQTPNAAGIAPYQAYLLGFAAADAADAALTPQIEIADGAVAVSLWSGERELPLSDTVELEYEILAADGLADGFTSLGSSSGFAWTLEEGSSPKRFFKVRVLFKSVVSLVDGEE